MNDASTLGGSLLLNSCCYASVRAATETVCSGKPQDYRQIEYDLLRPNSMT